MTGEARYRFQAPQLARHVHDVPMMELRILHLWQQKKDTVEIATRLGLTEFQAANILADIRDRHRGE